MFLGKRMISARILRRGPRDHVVKLGM